ncbi:LysR family transcriptional regulator [Sphingobium sp. AR-3-1]|uniref:LysR family transcriptional regulator n=1 Tax=Sphingobium psychrophilum TaxID=2728834 RepID=A0A7X9ZTV3_9SPHN|nr:LysR family transcriptional regulator [Sphingobium psychrophilum]NML10674.1 LysR family transcriptional regulator [Sphingobium psychrophilum]
MDQHPAPQTAAPLPPAADRAHWTPAKQRLFLIALLDTGTVAAAARSVGMSPTSAHRLRRRLAGTMFDRSWDWALIQHTERMADPFAPDRLPPTQQARQ